MKTLTERFWSHVDCSGGPDACWPWTGAKVAGYGAIKVGSRRDGSRKMAKAHRVSWEIANGPIVDEPGYHGTCVCHRCDNPPCVNPAHLFLGTPKENTRDMMAKGRHVGPVLPANKRESNPQAKLTAAIVRECRASHARGVSLGQLARRFNVSQGAMWQAVSGVTWGGA